MEIIFDNQERLTVDFVDSPVTDYFKKCYKHLQHVPFNFRERYLPYYDKSNSAEKLCNFAKKLNIDVDKQKLKDQQYLNWLHQIYETNYFSGLDWLQYHDLIHDCEDVNNSIGGTNAYRIDWEENAGPLFTKFDHKWKNSFVHNVQTGQVYTVWAELGKKPYDYWKDNEPDNFERLCQLSKPIVTLEPKLIFAVQPKELLKQPELEFDSWWNRYHDGWCNHWNISSWSYSDMYGTIVYGQIREIDKLQHLANNNHCPVKIVL